MPRKAKRAKKYIVKSKKVAIVLAKCCDNVKLGKNFERWISIKNKLNFKSDEEVVDHLLNLAELELRLEITCMKRYCVVFWLCLHTLVLLKAASSLKILPYYKTYRF